MTIYTTRDREKQFNTIYPYKTIISGLSDLLTAAQFDHIAAQMKDDYRNKDNFIFCDCLVLDLDNTHSEDPDAWRTLDDIEDTFPDVTFYYVKSRNYMKVKTKIDKKTGSPIQYEAREKYHIYFPLAVPIKSRKEAHLLMLKVSALFPFFDLGAAKPEQFYFGILHPEGGRVEGLLHIDEYIDQEADQAEMIISVRCYCDKVNAGEYSINDEIIKAVSQLCGMLKIENPLKDADEAPKKAAQPATATAEDLPAELSWIKYQGQKMAVEWFEKFCDRNNITHGKWYKISTSDHPEALAVPVPCPWEDDHTEDTGEKSTIVIIDLSGKYNFLCRHGHCTGKGWKEYRAFYEPEETRQEKAAEETPNKPKAKNDSGQADRKKILKSLKKLSSVKPQEVTWLLPNLLVENETNLVAAEGGAGKGFIVASIVSGVTRGKMPEVLRSTFPFSLDPQTVLYLTTEDSAEKVLRPRMEAAGADLDKVTFIDKGDDIVQNITFSDDDGSLEAILDELRPALVVFDPLQSFLPEKVRMAERNQMRRCLNHLSVLSSKFGTTFLIFCHLNKRDTTEARQALADSSDIWDIARTVWFVGNASEKDLKFFSMEKSNYSRFADTTLYRVNDDLSLSYAGKTEKRFKQFKEEQRILQNTNNGPTAKSDAKQYIIQILKDNDCKMLTEELDEVCFAASISKSTLGRAKTELLKDKLIKSYRTKEYGGKFITELVSKDTVLVEL